MKIFLGGFLLFLSFAALVKPEQKTILSIDHHPIVCDDPLLISGLELSDFDHIRCIQLSGNFKKGIAEATFLGSTAKYNITVYYIDEFNGESMLKLFLNDTAVGTIPFDARPSSSKDSYVRKQYTFEGINIQNWSQLKLNFVAGGAEKCRIEKLVFTPVGVFDGILKNLSKPKMLEVYNNAEEQQKARLTLPLFVNGRIDQLMRDRVTSLMKLTSAADWKASQDYTRAHLEDFFGQFPQRTPLHPHISKKIEHELYDVEDLYFESQPGYYVTANLYLPKRKNTSYPGVLFTCGHSDNGKQSGLYQKMCIGLALKGYVVLAVEPMGQGERIEYFNQNTKEASVNGAVSQHYYLGRPSFLVGRTLSGLRTWDCIRALDYLTSLPEVDTSKIAAVGNSGGGQMALLITAVDKRIKVCAAGHPGGQMEKNYLPGQNLIDRQIFSLIAPRPVRIIVGEKSGEEVPHRKKIEDIRLFDKGLGYDEDRSQLVLVDGVHDLKFPKRVAVYQWLNKWFDKEIEGDTEPPSLQVEEDRDLWATNTGLTLTDLGGKSGRTLNAEELKKIYHPLSDPAKLKNRIAKRIGYHSPLSSGNLNIHYKDTIDFATKRVEKLTFQSEEGVEVPSLIIRSKLKEEANGPVYIFVSDKGKPRQYDDAQLPFSLAEKGGIVLAIDVRGVGETNPTPTLPLPVKYSTCPPLQWIHDCLAIQSPGFGRTMLGMRAFDVARAIDFVKSQKNLKQRKVILIGEGLGGIWSLVASIYDNRVNGLVTIGTLSSYKSLITEEYYKVSSDYFWVPGALKDFDVPDLAALINPRPQLWIDPINGTGNILSKKEASKTKGLEKNLYLTQNSSNLGKLLSTHISNTFK